MPQRHEKDPVLGTLGQYSMLCAARVHFTCTTLRKWGQWEPHPLWSPADDGGAPPAAPAIKGGLATTKTAATAVPKRVVPLRAELARAPGEGLRDMVRLVGATVRRHPLPGGPFAHGCHTVQRRLACPLMGGSAQKSYRNSSTLSGLPLPSGVPSHECPRRRYLSQGCASAGRPWNHGMCVLCTTHWAGTL